MADRTYTKQEARNHMVGAIRQELPTDTDNEGQIVYYSGLYLWSDNTIHDQAQSKE